MSFGPHNDQRSLPVTGFTGASEAPGSKSPNVRGAQGRDAIMRESHYGVASSAELCTVMQFASINRNTHWGLTGWGLYAPAGNHQGPALVLSQNQDQRGPDIVFINVGLRHSVAVELERSPMEIKVA